MLDQAFVRVKDEEGSEEETKEECGGIDITDIVTGLDENSTQERSVLGVFLQQDDPRVGQESHWTQQPWGRGIWIWGYLNKYWEEAKIIEGDE